MSEKYRHALRMGAGFAFVAAAATAGTASRDLGVTATVVNSCAIRSATAIAFRAGTDLMASNGLISIACTPGNAPSTAVQSGVQSVSAVVYTDLVVVTVTF